MRKTIPVTDQRLQEALEDFQALSEVRGEIAQQAYDYQDDDTKEVISRIRDRLREAATGYVAIRLPGQVVHNVRIEQLYVDFNLLYIATEILKDLAFFDVRVGNYKFPPSLCVKCGADVVRETRKKRR